MFETMFSCHIQELLNEEKAEMEENQKKERGTRNLNFGAYHTLDTVGFVGTGFVRVRVKLGCV